MKRFWKTVEVASEADGWGVRLDGKPLRTPGRDPLAVPSQSLAAAIADEWSSVDDEVDPRSMPLTGLANAAIDRAAPDAATFARGLAAYGDVLRPGGWPVVGAIIAICGVIDAVFAPRLLRKLWQEQE